MSGSVGDNTARASGVIAAAGGGGKILQVVNAIKTDTSQMGTSFADISSLSVAITPSDTSSKIYINCSVMLCGCQPGFLKLLRDIGGAGYADSTFIGDSSGSKTQCASMSVNPGNTGTAYVCANIGYLDPTNTTSEVTYKLQGKSDNGTYWLGINKGYPDSNNAGYGRSASSITAYEVGA